MRETKDSGVDWIGEVPVNWEIKATRSYRCFRSFKNLPFPPDKKLIVTRDKRDFKNSEAPTLHPSKFVDQFRPPNYEYAVL